MACFVQEEALCRENGSLLPDMSTQSTSCGSSAPPSPPSSEPAFSDEEVTAAAAPISFSHVLGTIQNMMFGSCHPDSSAPAPAVALTQSPRRVDPYYAPPGPWGEARVRYQFQQLEHLGILGYGGFGSVTRVRCRITGQTFALKAMSKGMILAKNMQQHVKNEKLVLQRASSPFVVKLAACFNRDQHFYFLMEVAQGGDLLALYKKKRLWGSEHHARFYIACIATALSHLHQESIIYRDLKIENVVLDANGYAKLCDFGLARFVEPAKPASEVAEGNFRRSHKRAYTSCGTPDYMAPETVGNRGYSFEADWWSLGVLSYGMCTGSMPFRGKKIREILAKARSGIEHVTFPTDADWPELVKGLCTRSPEDRLPVREGGLRNVQELAWYRKANFDWDAHGKLQMKAPYILGQDTTSKRNTWDLDEMEKPRDILYEDPCDGWDDDFEDNIGPLCVSKTGGTVADGLAYL